MPAATKVSIIEQENVRRKKVALRKNKRENLRRRKITLLKKAHELAICSMDVALILRQNGRFLTYRSIDHESWPPSMEQIVRLCHLVYVNMMLRSHSEFHTLFQRTYFLRIWKVGFSALRSGIPTRIYFSVKVDLS